MHTGYAALTRAFGRAQKGDEIIGLYFPPSAEKVEVELMMFGPGITATDIKDLKNKLQRGQGKYFDLIQEKCKEIQQTLDSNSNVSLFFFFIVLPFCQKKSCVNILFLLLFIASTFLNLIDVVATGWGGGKSFSET
ncbi:hypothetical protein RFI_08336 [Reticulomyxa filosa]|uniref:Uncharacterized protein n=1 Tax=Reticulomyxa filosa TaxID=46433 RepID=X6NU37_RETFI|nr:hypothetical protein RFI_08336 [Reticulomyxa filosa]|eukprot:ETO28792.1 hypothetical protein RFI_08336 [Reticulomyxa filosa]